MQILGLYPNGIHELNWLKRTNEWNREWTWYVPFLCKSLIGLDSTYRKYRNGKAKKVYYFEPFKDYNNWGNISFHKCIYGAGWLARCMSNVHPMSKCYYPNHKICLLWMSGWYEKWKEEETMNWIHFNNAILFPSHVLFYWVIEMTSIKSTARPL